MNILLTGGSGFIGRNIQESFLSQRYAIFAPRHSELELLDEDAVRQYLDANKIDAIIHAGAKPGHRNAKDQSNIFYVNTRIFFNLARNLDRLEKIIVTGSGAIYDMRHYLPKMKEEYFDTHVPVDEHGLSKYVIGKYIEKNDRIVDLRIFSIFGKYEDYAIRFISNMMCKCVFNLPLTMKQDRRFDFLYVKDLMPVLDYFLQNTPKHHAYNVTPDETVYLCKMAEKIREISGKDLPIRVRDSGIASEYSGDNSRLKNECKAFAPTPFDISLRELYVWYEENKNQINKDVLVYDK